MNSQTDGEGNVFDFHAVACPTCGTPPTRVLGMRGGKFHRYGKGVPCVIMQCETCALIFPNPFPVPRNAGAMYGDPAKYFGDANEEKKIEDFRALIEQVQKRCALDDPALLDVGSGRGEMLVAAQRMKISRAVGLETTPVMIAHVKKTHGISLTPMRIEEFAARTRQRFHAVTLSAVLEHVHNPDTMIAAAKKLTLPGGVVYIEMPNEPNLLTRSGNFLNRLRGSQAVLNLSPTFAPFHVFGFNPRALKVLLSKHGFSLQELTLWAGTDVPARDDWRDHLQAFAAKQILRLGNITGTAGNMVAWARRT